MKKYLLGTVATLATVITALSASAGTEGFKRDRWSEPGNGWTVDYVTETNGCVLGRKHTDGTNLQIALLPAGSVLMVSNSKWRNIRDGQSYRLRMVMDGGSDDWNGAASGLWTFDGYPALIMGPLSQRFMNSFAQRNRADLYNGTTNKWVTALSLDGTANGLVALNECQNAHGEPHAPPGSPQQPQQPPKRGDFDA